MLMRYSPTRRAAAFSARRRIVRLRRKKRCAAWPGPPARLGAHLLAQQRQQHIPHAALTPAGKGVVELFPGRIDLGWCAPWQPVACRSTRPPLTNMRLINVGVGAFGVKNGFERIRTEIRNRMCRHEKPAEGGNGSNDFAHFLAGMCASLIRLGVRARVACLAPLPDAARASKQHECERHEKHLLHDHLEQKDHGRALA